MTAVSADANRFLALAIGWAHSFRDSTAAVTIGISSRCTIDFSPLQDDADLSRKRNYPQRLQIEMTNTLIEATKQGINHFGYKTIFAAHRDELNLASFTLQEIRRPTVMKEFSRGAVIGRRIWIRATTCLSVLIWKVRRQSHQLAETRVIGLDARRRRKGVDRAPRLGSSSIVVALLRNTDTPKKHFSARRRYQPSGNAVSVADEHFRLAMQIRPMGDDTISHATAPPETQQARPNRATHLQFLGTI